MKSLFIAFALIISASLATQAQSSLTHLQSDNGVHAAGLDTVTNAGNISQTVQIVGYNDLLTVQTAVTKLTGTPAGTVKLLGSVDGVKWDYASGAPDSLIVTASSVPIIRTWVIMPSKFQYYKATYKSTASTQTSTISTSALVRRK